MVGSAVFLGNFLLRENAPLLLDTLPLTESVRSNIFCSAEEAALQRHSFKSTAEQRPVPSEHHPSLGSDVGDEEGFGVGDDVGLGVGAA